MKSNFSNQTKSRSRQRGSIMLLVIVSLVLMALLGTAYIQVARMDRVATAEITGNNIEIVAKATVAYIGTVLRKDIVDSGNNFLNASQGDENYDKDWTNISVTGTTELFDREGDSLGFPKGGQLDDTWLASTIPDFSGTDPVWPHMTNLNAHYLRIRSDESWPDEYAVNMDDYLDSDTDVVISSSTVDSLSSTKPAGNTEVLGVDADADGFLDSRWTWAPIQQISGVWYVMAVRIIDNSSLLNINVATSLTSDGSTYLTGSNGPRGYYPTELDLSRLLSRYDSSNWNTGSLHVNEMTNWFSKRGLSTNNATPFDTTGINLSTFPTSGYVSKTGRVGAWMDVVRRYGFNAERYGIENDRELRHANGLNDPNNNVEIESPGGISSTLLRKNDVESTYLDVASISDAIEYFQGDTTGSLISGRDFHALRHMLTTHSGHNVYSPNQNSIHGTTSGLTKYDLLYQDGGADGATPNTRLTNIADRLQKAFKAYSTNYLGVTDSVADQIANEFALAIQDYSDSDDKPSVYDTGVGTKYYGLELMPFLREVYIQAGYNDVDIDDPLQSGPHPNNLTDGQFDHWQFAANSQAMVVEIGNPFDKTITAGLLNNRIQIAVVQGGSDVSTYTCTGLTSPSDDIAPRGKIIFVSNPTTAVEEGGTTRSDLTHATDGLNFTANVTLANGTLTFNAGSDIQVELRIDVSTSGPADWVTYDRLTFSGFQVPLLVEHMTVPTVVATNAHSQGSLGRDAQFHRYISNTGKGLIAGMRQPDVGGYRTGHDKIGDDIKGLTGDATLDNFQLPLANRPIFSIAELGWINMFGFTNETTGDFPQRLDNLGANRRVLTAGSTLPGSGTIPHAAIVFDEFTTLNPLHDGIDNDNDGQADPTDTDERFIPGTLNVNTAPLHLLTLGCSLPESIDDIQTLMEQVVDYRDNPSNRNTLTGYPITGANSIRTQEGISSIGELLLINPNAIAAGTNHAQDMIRYGTVGGGAQPAAMDLYPMPEETASSYGSPTQQMFFEGNLARFQFLAQNLSTRSDVFTAYIYLRGYRVGKFNKGPVESKRFFVIFDRSNVVNGTEAPRIIAVQEFN